MHRADRRQSLAIPILTIRDGSVLVPSELVLESQGIQVGVHDWNYYHKSCGILLDTCRFEWSRRQQAITRLMSIRIHSTSCGLEGSDREVDAMRLQKYA